MDGRIGRAGWRRTRVQAAPALALALALVSGCSAAPASSASRDSAVPAPTSPVSAPSRTPTAGPTEEPRPTLAYPEVQSHGELTLHILTPSTGPITLPIACEWIATDRVGWLTVLERPTIAGEMVTVHLNVPIDPDPPHALFEISRDDAATYAAWPAGASGTVGFVRRSPDSANGELRFDDLRPEAESWGAGPLPSPIETWTWPLGNDEAYSTVSGTVDWACQAPPTTVPTPAPVAREAPTPSMPPLPKLALVSGEQRQTGVVGCGGGWSIDGRGGFDSCGPSFQAPDDDRIIRLAPGEPLRFVLPEAWSFDGYHLGWVLQSEAERFRGLEPDTFAPQASADDASGRVLEFAAPPAGDWTVLMTWTATRGEDEMNSWSEYFRVVVEDD